jgi:Brp/Blh family beta-carotene 15,15'-monooxygenase
MTEPRINPRDVLPRSAAVGESRAALRTLAFLPGWIVVGVTTLAFAAGVSIPRPYQLLPLAVSAILLGLPHGAVDHLAVPRTRGEAVTGRWLAAIGVIYLVIGGLYAAVWFLAPVAAVAFFILLTWAHWGQGDVYPLVALIDGPHPAGRLSRLLTAATRGSLPMAVPFVAFPDQYELVVSTLAGLFDPAGPARVAAVFTPAARLTVAAVVAGLVVSTLAVGIRATAAGDRRSVAVDAAEVGLLVAFFATVPPIFAIGLYFCVWHALRHIVRLLAVDPAATAALESGRYGRALAAFARDSAPLTAAALGLLVLLALLVPATVTEPLELVGTYLVLIAVLTLPHVLIVVWMDREQKLWRPG